MSFNYRNQHDMAVPSFAYTDRHDNSAYVVIADPDGHLHKHNIGKLTDSHSMPKRMVPNSFFRTFYQDLYREAYPNEKIPPHEMSIGMYALTLSIVRKTCIYQHLQSVYGPLGANSLLDYAMFSILYKSDTTQSYQEMMDREVLFSDKLFSDTWYSRFFKELTEDQHHEMRKKLIRHFKAEGLRKVWLAIDGSNNDCAARQTFLTEYGFPKSHNKNKTIVGYMYAVDASTGRPVTYFVYQGSVPDCTAFQKTAVFLKSFELEIEGVILDRGFAVDAVFDTIEEFGWKYVIMLPTDTLAHTSMVSDHGEKIRWKSRYIIGEGGLFGTSDRKRLFSTRNRESTVCLYFDGVGGSIQSHKLSRKVIACKKRIEKSILSGKRAAVDKGLTKYLRIEGEGAERKVVIDYDRWDESMSGKGFFSLAVSDSVSPEKADVLYRMRDTSEKQFSILKSQEGYDATRVHSTAGIYSKFAVVFIASLVRYEIEKACQEKSLDTNQMIQSMDRIILVSMADGVYGFARNLTIEQKSLFAAFGTGPEDFEYLAGDFNKRYSKDAQNPDRKIPDKNVPLMRTNSGKPGRKPAVKTAAQEQEPQESHTMKDQDGQTNDDAVVKEKSKGGRPKGSKDTKPRKPRSDKGKLRGKRKQK